MARYAVWKFLAPHRQAKLDRWLAAGNRIPTFREVLEQQARFDNEVLQPIRSRMLEGLALKSDKEFLGE